MDLDLEYCDCGAERNEANYMSDLYGVKIVPLGDKPDEALFVSGARMTHEENLTTGEKRKIISFIDAIKVDITPTNQSSED